MAPSLGSDFEETGPPSGGSESEVLSPRLVDELPLESTDSHPSRPRRRDPTGLMAGGALLVLLLGALVVAVVGLLLVMAFT